MSEWQPIETAPRDGTPVVLLLPCVPSASYCVAKWVNHYGGEWNLLEAGAYAEDAEVYPDPTYWTPLPPPPEAPDERG